MRMKNIAAVLLLVASTGCEKDDPLFCKQNPGATGCEMRDAGSEDPDAVVDDDTMLPIDAQLCYGSGNYQFCLQFLPNGPVSFSGESTLSTNTSSSSCVPGTWMNTSHPEACFVVGQTVSVEGTLNVSGTRPLVLVSLATMSINGVVDAAGHHAEAGDKIGPGSGIGCATGTAAGADGNGGGGGAGGSFVGDGGNGGAGNSNNTVAGGIAATGIPPATFPLTALRGGCDGQAGGQGHGNAGAGPTGYGGGSVVLVAATSISLGASAVINASGGGGGKPQRAGGGGGGGSGGMIVLNAPAITSAGAFIVANGGAGGAGATDVSNAVGAAGGEPDPTMPTVAALRATSAAGDGGDGATEALDAQTGANGGADQAGGGGGGSKGYIQSNLSISNVTTSPAIVVVP